MRRRTYCAALIPFVAGCLSQMPGSDDSGPVSHQLGEAYLTGDDVRIRIDDLELADRYTAPAEFGDAPYDSLFVFMKVHATNEGDSPTSLPNSNDFQLLLGGDQYSAWSNSRHFETPVDGPAYTGADQARSGVTETGWLAFTVPRIPATATLSWYAADEEGAEVQWEQDLTTAMAEYPIIEFAEFLNPESPSPDEEFPIEFSIRNVGETEGTLEILVWTSGAASTEHEQTVTVPPDETITQQVPIIPESRGDLTIGVAPFDVTTNLTVE